MSDDAFTFAEATDQCRFPGVHRFHQLARAKIIRALESSEEDAEKKRAGRLASCCSFPSVRVKPDGSPILCLSRCRDRLCPLCSSMRGREAAEKCRGQIIRMNAPRFLTLTIVSTDDPLGARIDRLMQCFKAFRKSDVWREKVKGGIYSLEVTWNAKEAKWHPHLHLIIDGEFWYQADIADEWERVTGDSRIVHIAKVNDAARVAKYLAGYINTPPDLHEWGDERIREYATAMHGRRLIHTFGNLHGKAVDDADTQSEAAGSVHLVSIAKVRSLAAQGVREAESILGLMRIFGGAWESVASPQWGVVPKPPLAVLADLGRQLVDLCRAVSEMDHRPVLADARTPRPTPITQPTLFDDGRDLPRKL